MNSVAVTQSPVKAVVDVLNSKPIRYEDDGDILFVVTKATPVKTVAVTTDQGDYDLLVLPWESAYALASSADDVFAEQDAKPGIGFDEPASEEEFMAATLTTVRLGLTPPIVRLSAAQMEEIENERIGAHFSMNGFAY